MVAAEGEMGMNAGFSISGLGWMARRALSKLAFAFAVFVIVSPAILVMLWMLSLSLKNEVDNMASVSYTHLTLPTKA